MRIATYNFNNLFVRVKAFELEKTQSSKAILAAYYKAATIINKATYSEADKAALKEIIINYVENSSTKKIENRSNDFLVIQQIREKLYSKPTTGASKGQIVIKANGRADWEGWIELKKENVTGAATINTATVVKNANADIVCCVEVEDRIALMRFNHDLLNKQYTYSMLIDGNDDRGIDVGILSKHPITNIETRIFDTYKTTTNRTEEIFSRDCAIYTIQYNGSTIHLLCNHFKSKIGGGNAKRKVQATRVQEILKRYNLKKDYVVIAGDLNATPNSEEIQVLLNNKDLHNVVATLPQDERSTYALKKDEQIDYLIVSSALNKKLVHVKVDNSGIYKKANKAMLPTVTNITNAASDHALVYADFDL